MPAPSIEAALAMGAIGGPTVEAERLAFEAWMRGHCWELTATWDGKTYRGAAEHGSYICPHAMQVRQLWAAWRDRAALVPNKQVEGAEGCLQPEAPARTPGSAALVITEKNNG